MLIKPDQSAIDGLVRMALQEDSPWGDITSESLLPENLQITVELAAREDGCLCGEDLFASAFTSLGETNVQFFKHDGESFCRGDVLAVVSGSARSILRAERVALNFVQRMSGIATLTAQYVAATRGTKARIVDTRKTTPGLRVLERYAVRCGGGFNHRFSLSDAVLVKDNHLAASNRNAGELGEALRDAFTRLPHTTHIEVEIDRLQQIEPVLASGADTIMFDNFSLDDLRTGVQQVAGRALIEASGGVFLDRVPEIAATGVDLISVGALTHSARSLDLGLDIKDC